MTHLSVNLNAVAMLRNRRSVPWPSVTGIARIALDAGADGITVHPRPDERHIRRTDVFELVALLRQDYPGREFNIEGYPTEDFLTLVERAAPDQVTFVPDDPLQSTSDHGWNTIEHKDYLANIIKIFKEAGIRVSIFVDPDEEMVDGAAATGTDRIELYTESYASHYHQNKQQAIAPFIKAAQKAKELGLGLNAGHDLDLQNLQFFSQQIPSLAEVSIGHALISDALYLGFENTIQLYKRQLENQ
ncbi:MAG: pyridoxine 5'-phosphate synthase [Kaistia sp. SCN 65-12]|nr:MAG: pyridoxine 5'-phosphate synthase [Kaistia sp. SCN 65-12]